MRHFHRFLTGWLSNTKSLAILILVAVLWLELWAVNDTFFINCGNIAFLLIETAGHCTSDGQIDARIIDRIFFFLILLGVVASFIVSVIDTLKKDKKGD